MLYIPTHKRTGREYPPVTEERMNELKNHPATADSFRFKAIEEQFVPQPPIEQPGATSAKKSKKTQVDNADNNEQNIDSGDSSEPLQQN